MNSLENLQLTFSKKKTKESLLAEPNGEVLIEAPPQASSSHQATTTLVKEHSAVEVANSPEPPKEPKLVPPRTNKQGYRFNLIKDWLKRNT